MNSQQEQIREARLSERIKRPDGFTLIEVMLVLALVGILVSVTTVSYDHFLTKAKSVEGEIVVHEIERLESLYHASNPGVHGQSCQPGICHDRDVEVLQPRGPDRVRDRQNGLSGPRRAAHGLND